MKAVCAFIITDIDNPMFLMIVNNKKQFRGLIAPVHGKVKDNETVEDAAYREILEEVGLSNKQVGLMYSHPVPIKWNDPNVDIHFLFYSLDSRHLKDIVIDTKEIKETKIISLNKIFELSRQDVLMPAVSKFILENQNLVSGFFAH